MRPLSREAHAFWLREPGVGEIRPVPLPEPGPDEVLVRTLRSGVSRGTETLVFRGGVPPSQYAAMRAPFQDGDFPGPVKYGYLNVGVVEHGPPTCSGAPSSACTRTRPRTSCRPARSSSCPTTCRRRARCWPAPWRPRSTRCGTPRRCVGDRITVVGAGMVGCCVARLLARFPGVQVTLVDVDPDRAELAAALGVDFALPADAAGGRDLVVHTSATSAGLQLSLDLLAPEGTVIDLSWYGDARGHACRSAAPSTPAARHPGQPGRPRRAGPSRTPDARRPARAGARPAARSGLRRAAHRSVAASTSCPR